jgi:thymidylate synthase
VWHKQWLEQLRNLTDGRPVAPRGLATYEQLDANIVLGDARFNIIDVPERKLNFRFMVAEWLWMSFGHSDVATIARYNPRIAAFSDDGLTFTGAYGPHIGAQRPRVLDKLRKDPATRQAVIEIPRPYNAVGPTKDEPCTLSFQFLARAHELHCIATMRSSDAWLGLPYDVFNFTQLQAEVAGELGLACGWFSLRMGSSHLYESNAHDAMRCLIPTTSLAAGTVRSPCLPGRPPAWLDDVLVTGSLTPVPSSEFVSDGSIWFAYALALVATTNALALHNLKRVSHL